MIALKYYAIPFKNEMSRSYAENIAQLAYYWKPETPTDKVSLFKFLVAHKQIENDIQIHPVMPTEYKALADKYIPDKDFPSLLGTVGGILEYDNRKENRLFVKYCIWSLKRKNICPI